MKINSLIQSCRDSDFSIANIPFGIVCVDSNHFVASRIGDHVINVYAFLEKFSYDASFKKEIFYTKFLNPFIGLTKPVTLEIRSFIQNEIRKSEGEMEEYVDVFIPLDNVTVCMPIQIGDYTDFYSSIEHATNVGKMFRDPSNPLLPNWKSLPVGYHGRASSIVLSGTPIKRPKGQYQIPDTEEVVFGATKSLDIELEVAFVIGQDSNLGSAIAIEKTEDYIFGLLLFNDWSARDIQRWEYVPLGPFLGKNFGSTISAWVVTLEALDGFRVNGPIQDPAVLPYLKSDGAKNYDINLEVSISAADQSSTTICRTNFKYMYWSMCQQLAHHTSNGCNIRIGDIMASGTISGPEEGSYGSMLELSWKGTKPIPLSNGDTRKFLQDGDVVNIQGYNILDDGNRVGFGDCIGQII